MLRLKVTVRGSKHTEYAVFMKQTPSYRNCAGRPLRGQGSAVVGRGQRPRTSEFVSRADALRLHTAAGRGSRRRSTSRRLAGSKHGWGDTTRIFVFHSDGCEKCFALSTQKLTLMLAPIDRPIVP